MDAADAATPLVLELQVADASDGWADAGFSVIDDVVWIDQIALRLAGERSDGDGIVGWTLGGVNVAEGDLDGLPTEVADERPATDAAPTVAHPNGVTGLDHIVVSTPDLERTTEALAAAGVELRRIRETKSYGAPMRQGFFRFGPTILEVVSGDPGSGQSATEAPSTWFGLAFDVHDLDETAAHLGDGLGAIKPAVQRGRRIATFRHRQLGMSVAVAAMDDHAGR